MLLAALALFLVSLGFGVVIPILPQLTGGSVSAEVAAPTLLSSVYVSYATAKVFTTIPAGVWVDHAGPIRVLRCALALFGISMVGFLLPGGVLWFVMVRILEGAATGMIYPAVFARVVLLSPSERTGRNLGLVLGGGSSGLLLGPALSAWLAPAGFIWPIGIVCAASVLVLLWALVSSEQEDRPRPSESLLDSLRHLGKTARDVAFLRLSLPIAFNKLIFSALQGLLPLVGASLLGLDVRGVGGLFVLTGVVFVLSQPLGGFLSDRFVARHVCQVTVPILLLSLGALTFLHDLWWFSIAYALHIAAQSVIFTTTVRHTAFAYGSATTYGGIFSTQATITDVMTIFGPMLFLPLYQLVEAEVFVAMAATGLVLIVTFGAAPQPAGAVED